MNSGGPGDVDVLGAAHGDRLEVLVAHHGAQAEAAGAGPALLDGGEEDPVLPGQADGGDLRRSAPPAPGGSASALSRVPSPRRCSASRSSTLSSLIHR